ncbi:MAG: hypothetical protein JNM07_11680 [Phycisphaerae bacterium]|nr:hypothetical protein [Phycisphaerae bacterium]
MVITVAMGRTSEHEWAEMRARGIGTVVGRCWSGNPLARTDSIDRGDGGAILMSWSGTLGGAPGIDEPRNWLGPGWEALQCAIARARGSGTWWLRPNARHVLSDRLSCQRFGRERCGGGIGLALDPAAMLTVSMLATAGDHLERIYAGVSEIPGVNAAVVCGVRRSIASEGQVSLVPCAFGESLVSGEVILAAAARWVPAAMPVVTAEEDGATVAAALGRS